MSCFVFLLSRSARKHRSERDVYFISAYWLFYAIGGLFVIWLLVKVSIVIREKGTYFFDYFGIVIYYVTTNL